MVQLLTSRSASDVSIRSKAKKLELSSGLDESAPSILCRHSSYMMPTQACAASDLINSSSKAKPLITSKCKVLETTKELEQREPSNVSRNSSSTPSTLPRSASDISVGSKTKPVKTSQSKMLAPPLELVRRDSSAESRDSSVVPLETPYELARRDSSVLALVQVQSELSKHESTLLALVQTQSELSREEETALIPRVAEGNSCFPGIFPFHFPYAPGSEASSEADDNADGRESLVNEWAETGLFSDKFLWRNEKFASFCDWQIEIVRTPSGAVDTYKVHKLIVGLGKGKSVRLASEFEKKRHENGMGVTRILLEEHLADLFPALLDWMYYPFWEAHDFQKKSYVDMMILAEYLDIASLRDKLEDHYLRQNLTVEDLIEIWDGFVDAENRAARLVSLAADNIVACVSNKVVGFIEGGTDSEVKQLEDNFAQVADKNLILRIMSSDAFLGLKGTPNKEEDQEESISLREATNLRLSRFVAQFCITHDKGGSGTAVASDLLQQLVHLWKQKFESLYEQASSGCEEMHQLNEEIVREEMKELAAHFETVEGQVTELYKQQKSLLEAALNEKSKMVEAALNEKGKLVEKALKEGIVQSSRTLKGWFARVIVSLRRRAGQHDVDNSSVGSTYSV